jgi:sigma-B regulation protein RsbU (phosphoserine phosphatase)
VTARARGRVARLATLVEATQVLNSTLDLDELLAVILELATTNLDADLGTIYLIDEARGELWSRVLKAGQRVEIRLPLGTGIAGHVAQTGETVNVRDAAKDDRFYADVDRRTGFTTRTMLCLPMRNRDGRTIGVFQIINKRKGPFTADDESFLHAFSDQVALAIENARYHLAVVEKERADKELQIAATIQRSLLPLAAPDVPGYEVAALARPSRAVGGDYYTFVPMADGRQLLAIADVAGKGVPAALLVGWRDDLPLPDLVTRLNAFVHRNVLPGRYITFCVALLDTGRHTLQVVNAGHLPQYVASPGGALVALESSGFPLGIMPEASYILQTAAVPPGAMIVLYTDGVSEAMNAADEEYGDARLVRAIAAGSTDSAAEAHARILGDVQAFVGDTPPNDDLTLMVVRRRP